MKQNPTRLAIAAVTLLLATTLTAFPALADSSDRHHGMTTGAHMMGGHGGMSSSKGGHHGMMNKKGHDFGPHNAAVHFLKMGDMLELDDAQKARLRTLRDEWISAHAVNEAQLKAATSDLKGLLFDDTIRMTEVEKQLKTIGALEGDLWRAFAKQLQQIKGMLNDDQKARLKAHHGRHHR
ncbi:MAG: Spy/CpxP family protein refolding chaperone [Leptospirillia bacterium]